MRLALIVPLVAGLGCAGVRSTAWHDSLDTAIREATAADQPLLVLSIVGDLRKRCWLAAHAFRVKTLSDPEVARRLSENFVLVQHNQLPQLYCNNTVDPGVDRYPGDMVDRCPEGAGGGNVRTYVCTPDGRVRHLTLGYWKKERFLEELDHAQGGLESVRRPPTSTPLATAQENMIARGHAEARADYGKPIGDVLGRIEDEIFLSGKIGWE